MRLADVNHEDVRLVFVRLIELLDQTDRAEKGRSRTASEDQHGRLALQIGQLHGLPAVHVFHGEIGCGVADLQFALSRPRLLCRRAGRHCEANHKSRKKQLERGHGSLANGSQPLCVDVQYIALQLVSLLRKRTVESDDRVLWPPPECGIEVEFSKSRTGEVACPIALSSGKSSASRKKPGSRPSLRLKRRCRSQSISSPTQRCCSCTLVISD